MAKRKPNNTAAVMALGVSADDARALRRVAARLHRWQALQCGIENPAFPGWTFSVEEDPATGTAYMRRMGHDRSGKYIDERAICRNDNALARARLKKITARYPDLIAYIQPDVRGCPLYLIPRDRLPSPNADPGLYYWPRGVAVY